MMISLDSSGGTISGAGTTANGGHGPAGARQWLQQAIVAGVCFLLLACGLACHRESPQAAFDRIYRMLVHGDLIPAQKEAEHESQNFIRSNPEWSWRFKTLEAEAMLWQGQYENALNLLKSYSSHFEQPELAVHALTLIGVADTFLRRFSEADENIKKAEHLCSGSAYPGCGEVIGARGLFAAEQGDTSSAERFYTDSLVFARAHKDRFLESKTLRNLGKLMLAKERFDEAMDRSRASYDAAAAVDARIVQLVAKTNIGWADYRLGNREKALEAFQEAAKRAAGLGDVFDQANALTNVGYVYMDERQFDLAVQSFQDALQLAQRTEVKEYIYNALRVLARLSLQTGDLEKADHYARRAIEIARESAIHEDELYPLLVEGVISARRGDHAGAEEIFQQVEHDKVCPVFLKWEAQHSLARLYEDQKRPEQADREYRTALSTFETARADIRHEDYQLSFLTNAARIYDNYVHFLVARGKQMDALRWADYSRARTLAQGLGLLRNFSAKGSLAVPPELSAQEIARRVKGMLLFYWLGEKQSYLWAITAQKTQLFSLPPGAEIEATVGRYRKALAGPQDVFASANEDGSALYRMLVEPAAKLLPRDSRIFIIPDGGLNNLNFETLIVPNPEPHYWIEDATIADASSLRVLATSQASPSRRARRLLLVGDSVAPSKDYPELPKASLQMESVARHFPEEQRQIFARDQATPAAYLGSHLEQFSHIHFVAHGTASRLSPLDSAIVLSRDRANSDLFKLYARDIIRHPLHADLVTISACYGAGERAYSGEGLVGLSWAFQRAGAHHVIAALWEATDASTERLMEEFYNQLDKGADPDSALRSAKLALLHGSSFHNPFYWAPFQLYAGSGT